MSERCGTCKAEIVWALSTAGKHAPIDVDADAEQGNTLLLSPRGLDARLAVVLSKDALKLAREKGLPLHTSHWFSCPDRKHWRQRTDAAKRAGEH